MGAVPGEKLNVLPHWILRTGLEGEYTFQKFIRIADERTKWELHKGEVIMHSPATPEHEIVVGRIIAKFVEKLKGKGFVFSSNVVFKFSEDKGYSPDVSFLRKEKKEKIKKNYVSSPPDIAVEVISKSTKKYDFDEKLKEYIAGGVETIIYVIPEERKIHVWRKENKYKEEVWSAGEVARVGGKRKIGKITILPRISVDLRDIFE